MAAVLLDVRRRAAWMRARLDPGWARAAARAVRVSGPLDPAAVRDRLAALADRHPSLRARFADGDDGPVEVPTCAPPDVLVTAADSPFPPGPPAGPGLPAGAGLPFGAGQPGAAGLPFGAGQPGAAGLPFGAGLPDGAFGGVDPGDVPAVRVRLRREAAAEWTVWVLAHPAAVDPGALPGLVRELLGGTAGPGWRPFPAAATPAPQARAYWAGRLAGELGDVDLTGRSGPGRPGRGPAVPVPAEPVPPDALLAALALLLRRYTGVTDVPLGLQVPGGTVVLRVAAGGEPAVAGLRAEVAAGLRAALEHASVPLADVPGAGRSVRVAVALGELVAPGEDDWGRAVALGSALPGEPATLGGCAVRPLALAERAVPADLLLSAGPAGVELVADPAVLPAGIAGWLARDLREAVAAVAAGTGRAGAVLVRSAAEERAPAPAADDARFRAAELDRCVPARFADIARRYPRHPAVLGDDGTLSYAELAAAAAAVTAAVRAVPAPGGDDPGRVGLLLDHGPDTVTAILGVLGAGRAYVPLDPEFPVERLAAAVQDASVDALITTAGLADLARELTRAPVLDLAALPPAGIPAGCDCGPDTPAYVLYTSGSTGRPKGVVQAHRGILFQARQHALAHRVMPADRISVLSSFGFDMAVTDLFTALLTGAAAVPVDVRRRGLGHLAGALRERGVTVYHSTPTLFRFLTGGLGDAALDGIRVVLLGGEELTRRDVDTHRRCFGPDSVLVNGYGATEVSFALQDRPATPYGPVVPVGRPLDGLDVLLLAPDGRPAALTGEIVVRGRAVALGYRRRPQEQAARFTDLGGGVREYRTGDLGRRLPDGRIGYAGRRDRQLKVRGYRVEPGEVEAVLTGLPAVAQAAVVARTEAAGGTTELLAYVTPSTVDGVAARAECAARLPHFAVPRAVIPLAALPLTPTGKLDARALPDPPAAAATDAADPLERVVAVAWAAVLGVPAPGPDRNFFEAGGHSLLLARVQQRLERELGRPVPLPGLFEHPTIAATAHWLAGIRAADPDRARERMDRRRDARSRRPLPTAPRGPHD